MKKPLIALLIGTGLLGSVAAASAQDASLCTVAGGTDYALTCEFYAVAETLLRMPNDLPADGSFDLVYGVVQARHQEFSSAFGDFGPLGGVSAEWQLENDYLQTQFDASTRSIVFDFYSYTGGARPNVDYQGITLVATGAAPRILSADDLVPDSANRDALIALALDDLTRQFGMPAENFTLTWDNMRTFSLAPDVLTFYFSQTEVAAAALGPISAALPMDTVRDFLVAPYSTPVTMRYVVQPGDHLYQIARSLYDGLNGPELNALVQEIVALNNLSNGNYIQAGTELILPVRSGGM